MNCKRFHAILLSPALVGLALAFVTPAAHGHGNNPKLVGGGWPTDPPGYGPLISIVVLDPYIPMNADPPGGTLRNPFDIPGGLGDSQSTPNLIAIADPGAATAMGLSTNALFEPVLVVLDPIAPPTAMSLVAPGSVFDVASDPAADLIGIPITRAIPSPGTLALLGLAAMVFRRRRRH